MDNVILMRSLIKASIPFMGPLRRLKRRIIPYQHDSTNTGFAFDDALAMLEALYDAGVETTGDMLEVGSGWVPVVPLLFHLAGARSVVLTDIERLFDERSIASAAAFVRPRLPEVAERVGGRTADLEVRLNNFKPAYICPWSAESHDVESVDLIISRAVMEHVPANAVERLFGTLRSIVRPGGYMCHSVDNTDHWQHGAGKGSLVDFLRYRSESIRWQLASFNVQSYTNRLRHSDYLSAASRAGWTVIRERSHVPPQVLADVESMRTEGTLAPEFAERDPRDLATTASLIVARREC